MVYITTIMGLGWGFFIIWWLFSPQSARRKRRKQFYAFITNINLIKEELFTIYEQMLARRQWLEEKIKSIETQLTTFPKGKISCTRNGNYTKWYQSDGHTSTYLPKKERKLAEQLAMKGYLSLLLEDLRNEKKAIDLYVQQYDSHVGQAERFLQENADFRELLSTYSYYDLKTSLQTSKSLEQDIQEWVNTPYQKNPYFPEQLTHKTLSDYCVRSKSEAIIDMALRLKQIPFRYECELTLGETIVYPDFTVKHPKTGQIYYWEHFGRMDDSAYYHKAYHKLQLYTMYEIVPSIQLITTYETKKHPLSVETVDDIINKYFC